uniref:Uncharacterized protein n=1 Tax=Acrobeloides nanus TaxID=290746 RepID=A0A914CBS1_9BILA
MSKSHGWLAKWLIHTKCTDDSRHFWQCIIGLLVLGMQIPPILLPNWLNIVEPRTINKTDDKGDIMEVPFDYHAGYFKICREFNENYTAYGVSEFEDKQLYFFMSFIKNFIGTPEFSYMCNWNPIYTGEDLTEFSFATIGILARLTVPALMHIIGASFCVMAFLLSLYGYWRKDVKTVYAAILYVLGGIVVSMSVLQFICIVDDEMHPRMKPNAAGEPSKFNYKYGISFLSAALCFLPVQLCVYLQTYGYFRRYPTPLSKAVVVPGLRELLSHAQKRNRIPLPGTYAFNEDNNNLYQMHSPIFPTHLSPYYRRESRTGRETPAFGIQHDLPSLSPPLTASIINKSSNVYFC